jgi:hypothetical protein
MSFRIYLAAAFVVCSGLSLAQGAIIVSDNFDSYADTAAFAAAWPPVSPQPTGTIDTSRFVSSPNSVNNVGTTVTASAQRNGRSFAETDTFSSDGVGGSNLPIGDKLIWSFDFYDSATGNPQRNYANLQDGTGPATSPAAQLISLGLNNNQLATDSGGDYYMARILGFAHTAVDPDGGPNEAASGTSSGAYFKLNDFGVGLRSVGWHNLKVALSTDDGTSVDMDFFVDSTLAEKVYNIGDALALRSYDVIRMGSGLSNSNVAVNFDNMQLEYQAVPEPPTLLLASVLVLSLLSVRRRAAGCHFRLAQ